MPKRRTKIKDSWITTKGYPWRMKIKFAWFALTEQPFRLKDAKHMELFGRVKVFYRIK
jgi:hypothetical protein